MGYNELFNVILKGEVLGIWTREKSIYIYIIVDYLIVWTTRQTRLLKLISLALNSIIMRGH